MKISISLNPFDRCIHLTVCDLSVTDKQFFEIAQIADKTLQQNIAKENKTND